VTALFIDVVLCRWLVEQHWSVTVLILGGGVVAAVIAGPYLADVPLSIGLAWPCAVFVMSGFMLRRYRDHAHWWIAVPVLVAAAVGLGTHILEPLTIKSGSFGQPVIGFVAAILVSGALIVLAEVALRGLRDRASAVATLLASTALVVVLLHPLVLWLLDAPPGTWLDFLLALTLPVVLALVLGRTALSEWFTGAARTEQSEEMSRWASPS
jgi:fucose 4-O-acetylase-like acetyltransferase